MKSFFETEPFEGQVNQFFETLSAMVVGDFFVQMPPDLFDEVGFGGDALILCRTPDWSRFDRLSIDR